MNNDNFDDIIKQKADNHQASVPADAWDNIAKEKKEKPSPVFWFSVSSLLIAAMIGTYIFSHRIDNNAVAINQNFQSNNSSPVTLNQGAAMSDKNSNAFSQTNKSENNNLSASKNNDQSNKANKINKTHDDLLVDINDNHKSNTATSITTLSARPNSTVNKQTNKVYALRIGNSVNHLPNNNSNDNASTSEQSIKTSNTQDINAYSYSKKVTAYNRSNRSTKMRSYQINSQSAFAEANIAYTKHKKNKYSQGAKYTTKIVVGEVVEDDRDSSLAATINTMINSQTAQTLKASSDQQLSVDCLLKKKVKIDSVKMPDQNKTAILTAKKMTKHSLIIDGGLIPFVPFQNYDRLSSITRTDNNSKSHSTYVANTWQTSLQPSVAIAFSIKTNITRKLMIGAGIQYAQIKENVKTAGTETDTTYSAIQILATNNQGVYLKNDTSAAASSGTNSITATNSYRIISIPLFVTYTLFSRRSFSVGLTGGVSLNISQYHNTINGALHYYSNGTKNSSRGTGLTMDVLGGVRFCWTINRKYQLFAEPDFRYNLNKYGLKNTVVNENINQVGMSVGVSYKIQ
jgi:hypothetical protein